MHQLIRAMTVAGMVASGLPLLTEAADAQIVNGWHKLTPVYCYFWVNQAVGSSTATSGLSMTASFDNGIDYIGIPDTNIMSAVLTKACFEGSVIWGWYGPYSGSALSWTEFYVSPGLQ
jgi:hypothetical protein